MALVSPQLGLRPSFCPATLRADKYDSLHSEFAAPDLFFQEVRPSELDPPRKQEETGAQYLHSRSRVFCSDRYAVLGKHSGFGLKNSIAKSLPGGSLLPLRKGSSSHRTRALHEAIPWHLVPDAGPMRDMMFTGLGAFVGVVASVVVAWTFQRQQRKVLAETAERGPAAMIPEVVAGAGQKESVEWVNMVIHKIWKVYRRSLEAWLVGLLQPAIDSLPVPSYVTRVEIAEFSLHYEPLSVRTVQRRASRRANDLQYHIGLRYTGDARCLLKLHVNLGGVETAIPVGVHDLDVDAELWVKLRLTPKKPYVGTLSLAFVRLPTIKLVLAPFRIVNLFAIPFLSSFLSKLLTVDLPRLLVLPRHITFDFLPAGEDPNQQQHSGQAEEEALSSISLAARSANMVLDLLKSETFTGLAGEEPAIPSMSMSLEPSDAFVGELSVTLCEARNLPAFGLSVWSNPFCTLSVGDTVVESKRNSETSHPSGARDPVWNQDFNFWVEDPKSQKLTVTLRDTSLILNRVLGFVQVPIRQLRDCVPLSMWLPLLQDGPFGVKEMQGEVRLLLTYKSYVDRETDHGSSSLVPSSSTSVAYIKVFSHSDEDKVVDSDAESDAETEDAGTFVEDEMEMEAERLRAMQVLKERATAKEVKALAAARDTPSVVQAAGAAAASKDVADASDKEPRAESGASSSRSGNDGGSAVGMVVRVVGGAAVKVGEVLHLGTIWRGTRAVTLHFAGHAGNGLGIAAGALGAGALGVYARAKGLVQGVQMGLSEISERQTVQSGDDVVDDVQDERLVRPEQKTQGEEATGSSGRSSQRASSRDIYEQLEDTYGASTSGDYWEKIRSQEAAARLIEWELEKASKQEEDSANEELDIEAISKQGSDKESVNDLQSESMKLDEKDRWKAVNGAINDLMDFFNR